MVVEGSFFYSGLQICNVLNASGKCNSCYHSPKFACGRLHVNLKRGLHFTLFPQGRRAYTV